MLIQDLLCAEHTDVAIGTTSSFLPCGNLRSNGSGGQLWNNYFHPPISTENSRIRRCSGGFGFSKEGVNLGWRKASRGADGETEPQRRSRTWNAEQIREKLPSRGTGVGSPGMGKDWTGRRRVAACARACGRRHGQQSSGTGELSGCSAPVFFLEHLDGVELLGSFPTAIWFMTTRKPRRTGDEINCPAPQVCGCPAVCRGPAVWLMTERLHA